MRTGSASAGEDKDSLKVDPSVIRVQSSSALKGQLVLLLKFALIPAIGIAGPFLVYPAITRHFGAPGLSSIAIGQAVGVFASSLVELGWGLNGPRKAASASRGNTRELVSLAIATTFSTFVPVSTIAAAISYQVAPAYPLAAALTAVATALAGTSLNWYFIGTGQPSLIFLTDALPRVIAAAASYGAFYAGAPLIAFPILLSVLSVIGLILAIRMTGVGDQHRGALRPRAIALEIRQRLSITFGRSFSLVYLSLPIVVVGIVRPSDVATYAATDRLLRLGLLLLVAVPNSLQKWLSDVKGEQLRRRLVLALQANVILGLLAGSILYLFGRIGAELLFSGVATPSKLQLAIGGLLAFLTCASRATGGLCLVHLGREKWVGYSAIVGALTGVPTLFLSSSAWGATGALVAVLITETLVLLIQAVALIAVWNSSPRLHPKLSRTIARPARDLGGQ